MVLFVKDLHVKAEFTKQSYSFMTNLVLISKYSYFQIFITAIPVMKLCCYGF